MLLFSITFLPWPTDVLTHRGSNGFPVSFLGTFSILWFYFPFFSLAWESKQVSSTINCRKRFVGAPPLLFCLSSSTTGKYEADPVYVCRNLKMSWYAVVIKEESRAVYPVEYRALNQKTPLGPPGRLWRALCFKMQGQDFCYWICSLHSGNRKVVRVVPL